MAAPDWCGHFCVRNSENSRITDLLPLRSQGWRPLARMPAWYASENVVYVPTSSPPYTRANWPVWFASKLPRISANVSSSVSSATASPPALLTALSHTSSTWRAVASFGAALRDGDDSGIRQRQNGALPRPRKDRDYGTRRRRAEARGRRLVMRAKGGRASPIARARWARPHHRHTEGGRLSWPLSV
jgi:hypothetical protein